MKKENLKRTFALLSVIFVTTAFLMTGCSKQDNKETSANKEQKTESTQQQNTMNNMNKDTSMKTDNGSTKNMNNDKMNMDMEKDSKSDPKGNIEHKMINIPSAQCEICQGKIEKALKKVAGVKNYEVDIDAKLVHVNFDKTITSIGKIENAITAAGYDANGKKANPDAYEKLDDCCKLPQDRKKNKSN